MGAHRAEKVQKPRQRSAVSAAHIRRQLDVANDIMRADQHLSMLSGFIRNPRERQSQQLMNKLRIMKNFDESAIVCFLSCPKNSLAYFSAAQGVCFFWRWNVLRHRAGSAIIATWLAPTEVVCAFILPAAVRSRPGAPQD
jgi:hypothetical protein